MEMVTMNGDASKPEKSIDMYYRVVLLTDEAILTTDPVV
jgi:hypothetical protein